MGCIKGNSIVKGHGESVMKIAFEPWLFYIVKILILNFDFSYVLEYNNIKSKKT